MQCLHYDQGVRKNRSIAFAVIVLCCAGAVEVGFIYAAKAAEERGYSQVTTTLGILAVVFIIGGLLPQYLEIYKYKAVIGISLIFLGVDLAGGLFSALSLCTLGIP